MPLLNSLATPYAEALLQVTEARGESQTVADQCKQLLEIWNDSEDFRAAMVSPVFEPDAKKKVLQWTKTPVTRRRKSDEEECILKCLR